MSAANVDFDRVLEEIVTRQMPESGYSLWDDASEKTKIELRHLAGYSWHSEGDKVVPVVRQLVPLIEYMQRDGVATSWQPQAVKLAQRILTIEEQDRVQRILDTAVTRDLKLSVFMRGIPQSAPFEANKRSWVMNDLKFEQGNVPERAQAEALRAVTLFDDLNEVIDQWTVAHDVEVKRSTQPTRRRVDPVLLIRWNNIYFEVARWS